MKGLFSSDDVRNHAELRREIRLVAAEARGEAVRASQLTIEALVYGCYLADLS